MRQVRARALGAFAHPDLPLNYLVAELAPQRDASRTPLFQVMFVLHDSAGVSQVSKVTGNRQLETGTSKFDLTLLISESERGLDGMIEYSTDLFDAETMRALCRRYARLLEAIASEPDQPLARLPLLTAEERRQLLVDWNDTTVVWTAPGRCVHELIEQQAGRTPDQVAVVADRPDSGLRDSVGPLVAVLQSTHAIPCRFSDFVARIRHRPLAGRARSQDKRHRLTDAYFGCCANCRNPDE